MAELLSFAKAIKCIVHLRSSNQNDYAYTLFVFSLG